jgi:hypothetical protein
MPMHVIFFLLLTEISFDIFFVSTSFYAVPYFLVNGR